MYATVSAWDLITIHPKAIEKCQAKSLMWTLHSKTPQEMKIPLAITVIAAKFHINLFNNWWDVWTTIKNVSVLAVWEGREEKPRVERIDSREQRDDESLGESWTFSSSHFIHPVIKPHWMQLRLLTNLCLDWSGGPTNVWRLLLRQHKEASAAPPLVFQCLDLQTHLLLLRYVLLAALWRRAGKTYQMKCIGFTAHKVSNIVN